VRSVESGKSGRHIQKKKKNNAQVNIKSKFIEYANMPVLMKK